MSKQASDISSEGSTSPWTVFEKTIDQICDETGDEIDRASELSAYESTSFFGGLKPPDKTELRLRKGMAHFVIVTLQLGRISTGSLWTFRFASVPPVEGTISKTTGKRPTRKSSLMIFRAINRSCGKAVAATQNPSMDWAPE